MEEALAAADMLAAEGLRPLVLSCHTVKPLEGAVALLVERGLRCVLVLEEHVPAGGLWEALAARLGGLPVLRAGLPDRLPCEAVGETAYMRKFFGLDAFSVAKKTREAFRRDA